MDAELEEKIDRVGRDKVFRLARERGWIPPEAPPKWVWSGLCDEVLNEQR